MANTDFNMFDAQALANARLRGARDGAAMRLPDPELYGRSASYRWAYAAALVAISQEYKAKANQLSFAIESREVDEAEFEMAITRAMQEVTGQQ